MIYVIHPDEMTSSKFGCYKPLVASLMGITKNGIIISLKYPNIFDSHKTLRGTKIAPVLCPEDRTTCGDTIQWEFDNLIENRYWKIEELKPELQIKIIQFKLEKL